VVTRQIGAPLGAFPLTRPFERRNTTLLRPVIHCTVKRPKRSWNGLIGLDRSGGTVGSIEKNGDEMTEHGETPPPPSAQEPNGHNPSREEAWFSDLTLFWMSARQQLEGYALRYLSPSTPPEPMEAKSWMDDGAHLVADLWSLWIRGVTLTAFEGGRLVADALDPRRQKDDSSGTH
jgi:hypothetical protein